jgi:SAM-dependent methyltransferase
VPANRVSDDATISRRGLLDNRSLRSPSTMPGEVAGDRLRETIRSYTAGAQEYAEQVSAVDLVRERHMFACAIPSDSRLILDAGCGSGRDSQILEALGLEVIGLDLSEGLLEVARQAGVPLIQGDLRRLPIRDSALAGVWACASLVHLDLVDAAGAIAEFARTLGVGGALFISVRHGRGEQWRRDGRGGRRWHQLYDRNQAEQLVTSAGLSIRHIAVEPGVLAGTWVNLLAVKEG